MSSRATSRAGRALAALVCATLALTACGGDDSSTAQGGTTSASPAPSSTSPSAPTEPTEPPEPAVTPADGPLLDTTYATIRVPRGWKLRDNFGFDHIQQATARTPYVAGVHFAVYQREASVTSVEEAARFTARDLRTRMKMGRFDVGEEVVIGGARATRLDGRGTRLFTKTAYAVMVGDLRWALVFDFERSAPEDEREAVMASVLDTWEFVRP